jgi:hypothetical protein
LIQEPTPQQSIGIAASIPVPLIGMGMVSLVALPPFVDDPSDEVAIE